MKKIFIIISVCCLTLLTGCQNSKSEDSQKICGMLVDINSSEVTIDIVEYITSEDTERIAELELDSDRDMPNGYYIYNPDNALTTYSLTDETEYYFFDWKEQFQNEYDDRYILTKDVQTFIEYIGSYDNATPGMPFFYDIKNGEIIKITEELMM